MLKIIDARFLQSARESGQYPKTGLPEFAFYGKSNVGKSSLINALVNRKSLVKTGARPGVTTEINWFVVNDRFCLVDLPGTGFAKLPGSQRAALGPIIAEYCTGRQPLKAVFYLLDLRREPGDEERAQIEWFQSLERPLALVGTKADKLSKNQLTATLHRWAEFFGVEKDSLFATSSENHQGREALLSVIQGLL
ncbi:MAG: ribosome biogenesis GTP-binding protein YihA/YsxC [Spirochaetales bacterium]